MRMLRIYLDQNLGCGHDGLTYVARRDGYNIKALGQGECLIFINKKMDKIKLFASNDTIAYRRLPHGQIVDLRAIRIIVQTFHTTGKLDYEAALAKVIETKLMGASTTVKAKLRIHPEVKAPIQAPGKDGPVKPVLHT